MTVAKKKRPPKRVFLMVEMTDERRADYKAEAEAMRKRIGLDRLGLATWLRMVGDAAAGHRP